MKTSVLSLFLLSCLAGTAAAQQECPDVGVKTLEAALIAGPSTPCGIGLEITIGGVSYTSHEGDVELTHHLPSRTVVWAAGVAGSALGRSLEASAGATLDRAGRVIVAPDLSLPGSPEIFVIGDAASVTLDGKPAPGVAPAAKQQKQVMVGHLARAAARFAGCCPTDCRLKLTACRRAGRWRIRRTAAA